MTCKHCSPQEPKKCGAETRALNMDMVCDREKGHEGSHFGYFTARGYAWPESTPRRPWTKAQDRAVCAALERLFRLPLPFSDDPAKGITEEEINQTIDYWLEACRELDE